MFLILCTWLKWRLNWMLKIAALSELPASRISFKNQRKNMQFVNTMTKLSNFIYQHCCIPYYYRNRHIVVAIEKKIHLFIHFESFFNNIVSRIPRKIKSNKIGIHLIYILLVLFYVYCIHKKYWHFHIQYLMLLANRILSTFFSFF